MISFAVSICSIGALLQPAQLSSETVVALAHTESKVVWEELTDDIEDGALDSELRNQWYVLETETQLVLIERKLIDFRRLKAQLDFCQVLNSNKTSEVGQLPLSSLNPDSRGEFSNFLKSTLPEWSSLFEKPDFEILVRPVVALEFEGDKATSWMRFEIPHPTADAPTYPDSYRNSQTQIDEVKKSLNPSGSIEVFPWALQTRVLKAQTRDYGKLTSDAIKLSQDEFSLMANEERDLTRQFVESYIGKRASEQVLALESGGELKGPLYNRAVNMVDNYRHRLGLSEGQDPGAWFSNAKITKSSFRLTVEFRVKGESGKGVVFNMELPRPTDK